MNRREVVALAAAGIAAGVVCIRSVGKCSRSRSIISIKALAFDGFPVFDPRPVSALAEELFRGKGADLSGEWRIRQFEYTWLRVASQH
jgi:2-haloacid dehalogenase